MKLEKRLLPVTAISGIGEYRTFAAPVSALYNRRRI